MLKINSFQELIMRPVFKSSMIALSALLVLSACGKKADKNADVAALDEKLTGKGSDPAMNAALDDRILVDPAMTDNANVNVVKTADKPLSGAVPPDNGYDGSTPNSDETGGSKMIHAPAPKTVAEKDCTNCGEKRGVTLGALAAESVVSSGGGNCGANITYGAGWATRMPTEFPVYPKGSVKEAGGIVGASCNIRAVSFITSAARQDVVDYYYSRAKRSGYSAEYTVQGGDHMLGGTRNSDDGTYAITFTAISSGGTAVDIVANNGN